MRWFRYGITIYGFTVTPHLNRRVETVQIRGHNIWFYAELTKIIPNYHQKHPLVKSSGYIRMMGDNEKLCAIEPHLQLEKFLPTVGLEPMFAGSEGQHIIY